MSARWSGTFPCSSSGESHPDARGQLDSLAPAELLATERPVLPDDEVDLEGGARIDDVELEAAPERVASPRAVDVVTGLEQAVHERVELLRGRIDDDVGVVGRPGSPVVAARHGAGDHVGNAQALQEPDEVEESPLLGRHGSTSSRFGQARRTTSSPCRSRA
jgi:hypothetical protein